MTTVLQLRTMATTAAMTTVTTIAMIGPSRNPILGLEIGATISLATLQQVHATDAKSRTRRTYRVKCFSRHNHLDLYRPDKILAMEGLISRPSLYQLVRGVSITAAQLKTVDVIAVDLILKFRN